MMSAIDQKCLAFTLLALLAASVLTPPNTVAAALAELPAAALPYNRPLAKIWHSESTKHDFSVQVNNQVFRADWVNIPPEAAKQGASIHTECVRSGLKWVGTSNVKMLVAIPGAPAGKDTKLCPFTVRFEVDTLTSLKITGHSESLKSFDAKTCRVQQTNWAPFTWVPKN